MPALLAQERVVGAPVEHQAADQLLALAVGLGHDVDVAGLGVGDADPVGTALADHGRPRRGPPRARGRAARPGRLGTGHVTSLGGACGPPTTGCSPRGFGQQPAAHRSGAAIRPPTATRGTSSPRSVAARSTSSSRGRPTKRGSMPGVAARLTGNDSRSAVASGLGVEVVDDLHVVGDEADRHDHRGARAVLGELLEVVVDVGLEPRHAAAARSASRTPAATGACGRPPGAPARPRRWRRTGAGRGTRDPTGRCARSCRSGSSG